MEYNLTATSTLALFETTKAQRQAFAAMLVNAIREGEIDALKIHMQIKSAEHLLKAVVETKEYKDLLLEEAQKHGKKFETYNAEFQVKEHGTKWDYGTCNDSQLIEWEAEAAELERKIKARKTFLQNIPAGGVANPENGEILYPAVKSSTTIVQCTLL